MGGNVVYCMCKCNDEVCPCAQAIKRETAAAESGRSRASGVSLRSRKGQSDGRPLPVAFHGGAVIRQKESRRCAPEFGWYRGVFAPS